MSRRAYRRGRLLPRDLYPYFSWAASRLRQLRAGEGAVGESLVEYALERERETHGVSTLAVVETEGLLVEVAEEMERFDRHVGALEGSLQETPEVLQAVDVNCPST